jgi:hypothetical protein
VSSDLYNLPPSAQIFYRRFLLHHNFSTTSLNLDTIVQEMNFLDKNKTNLVNVMEQNILEPLKQNGLITSYEKTEGLLGIKYEISLPEKTNHNREGIDGS